MLEVKDLIIRLSKPMWLEGADQKFHWQEGSHGVFNIFYILAGKPTLGQVTLDYFAVHHKLWVQASNLGARFVDGVPVEMTATVLKPREFAKWLGENVKGVEARKFKDTV